MGATGICNRRPKEATCRPRHGGLEVEGVQEKEKWALGRGKHSKPPPQILFVTCLGVDPKYTRVPLPAQQRGVSASREPARLTQACTSDLPVVPFQ